MKINKKVAVADTSLSREGIGIIKRNENKKIVAKSYDRWKSSGDPKLADGVNEKMIIDKTNNIYKHEISNAETGEVIHKEKESLTEHNTKNKDKK